MARNPEVAVRAMADAPDFQAASEAIARHFDISVAVASALVDSRFRILTGEEVERHTAERESLELLVKRLEADLPRQDPEDEQTQPGS